MATYDKAKRELDEAVIAVANAAREALDAGELQPKTCAVILPPDDARALRAAIRRWTLASHAAIEALRLETYAAPGGLS